MKLITALFPVALLYPSLALAASYNSKGCYSQSDLSSYLSSKGEYTWQSNSHCQQECSGYAIAATGNGDECYCGNKLPSNIESASSSQCSTNCAGYPFEKCGGDGYLSVYTNGDEDTSDSDNSSSSSGTSSSATSTSSSSSATSATGSSTSTTSSRKSSSSASSTSSSSTSSSASTTGSSSSTSSSKPTTQVSVITSIISASNTVITSTQSTTPTSSSPSSSSSASSSGQNNQDVNSKSSGGGDGGSGLSKGAIAGIAIGVAVAVLALIGLLVFIFIRTRRSQDDDDDNGSTNEKGTSTPIHNDMSFYHPQHGNQNSFDGFDQPTPIINTTDFGRKRLSNGSLPDERHQKTLRVTNPDETTLNDTTLHNDDHYPDSDDSDFDGKFRA